MSRRQVFILKAKWMQAFVLVSDLLVASIQGHSGHFICVCSVHDSAFSAF